MKKILAINLFLVLIGVTACEQTETSNKSKDHSEVLFKVSSRINANLPMIINRDTHLISTSPGMNSLTYNYKLINDNLVNIKIKEFKEKMSLQVRNFYCTSESQKYIRDLGFIAKYRYVDLNDIEIAVLQVDPKTCNIKI